MRIKWAFLLLLMFAVLGACLAGCGGSSPTSSVPSVTYVDEQLFRVALPGNWLEEPRPDTFRWIYRSYDESGQFIVTASAFTFASDEERTQTLQLMVDSARNARAEMGQRYENGHVTMSEVDYSESGASLVATFSGSEDLTGRLFASKVVCTSHSCVVIDYDSYDAEVFDERANSILDSVDIL
jgi:hypothetical protein